MMQKCKGMKYGWKMILLQQSRERLGSARGAKKRRLGDQPPNEQASSSRRLGHAANVKSRSPKKWKEKRTKMNTRGTY